MFLNCISKVISCLILTFATFYSWSKLTEEKIDFKNYRVYISLFSIVVFSIFNYYIINQFIRIVIITLFLTFNFWYIFRKDFQKCAITVILVQLIIMVAEIIFAFGLIFIFKVNPDDFVNVYFSAFLTNVIISIICILLINIKYVKKIHNILVKITDKITKRYLLIMTLIIMIIANIMTMLLYYDFNFIYLMIFNMSITIIYFIIIFNSLKNKNNYIKVYDKYNTTLNSLKEYEDILDRYRVSTHENKNQLLTIRNMLPKTNKKIISYIDTIVDNKLKDDDRVMIEVCKIPAGGLRGLVYSKVLTMKELKIKYELGISKDVKTVDLINKIDDFAMLDICKVIGIYIDNAIQEVGKLKEKYINIEMYLDDLDLIIAVSNNYKNPIEIEKLEECGYTTKEEGHGYGLTLAREIIDNNKKLSNQKMITKETFTQILKIQMTT